MIRHPVVGAHDEFTPLCYRSPCVRSPRRCTAAPTRGRRGGRRHRARTTAVGHGKGCGGDEPRVCSNARHDMTVAGGTSIAVINPPGTSQRITACRLAISRDCRSVCQFVWALMFLIVSWVTWVAVEVFVVAPAAEDHDVLVKPVCRGCSSSSPREAHRPEHLALFAGARRSTGRLCWLFAGHRGMRRSPGY